MTRMTPTLLAAAPALQQAVAAPVAQGGGDNEALPTPSGPRGPRRTGAFPDWRLPNGQTLSNMIFIIRRDPAEPVQTPPPVDGLILSRGLGEMEQIFRSLVRFSSLQVTLSSHSLEAPTGSA
ncbi:hypothetical protein N658DRAFT_561902 [Parathielavia hyrcaniae]|uniref:Secreted protein n=1 Tax=Parathielavia hyrcaniae TaxID=113614 RepID=A0AAN6PUD4_9PEZI|nr:hypothetical protein N658DRAFT_561902 [Parathielavia hyrcaniae]